MKATYFTYLILEHSPAYALDAKVLFTKTSLDGD